MQDTRRYLPLAALLFAGCMVGPHFETPKSALPEHYAEQAAAEPADPVPQAWWKQFHDPQLDALIARALENNRDLKMAVSRIREARAETAVVAGGLLPELDASGGYNRARGSRNVSIPLGGSGSSGSSSSSTAKSAASSGQAVPAAQAESPESPSPQTAQSSGGQPGGPASPFGEGGLPGVTTNLYQVGFDAVWEADLFGGVRRSIEASAAEAAAAVEGERGVRISLMAQVASDYLQLRGLQSREAILRRSIGANNRLLKLEKDTFDAGLGDEVAVANQAAQVSQTRAQLPPVVAQEHQLRQALAFLLAQDPESLEAELAEAKPLPEQPPQVPVGVPADLIRRRPDIRQAEQSLKAAYANVGVAQSQLYPSFSISGSLGLDSSTLKHLIDRNSYYYMLSPGVRWPLLDWSRLQAGIKVETELQSQSLLGYQNAVAQALQDVEESLLRYEAEKEHQNALAEALGDARRAQTLSVDTFRGGLANELASLNAEKVSLQAEDALAQSRVSLATDVVGLYKALGGGWDVKP